MGWGKYRGPKGEWCCKCGVLAAELTYKPNVSHSMSQPRHWCWPCRMGAERGSAKREALLEAAGLAEQWGEAANGIGVAEQLRRMADEHRGDAAQESDE